MLNRIFLHWAFFRTIRFRGRARSQKRAPSWMRASQRHQGGRHRDSQGVEHRRGLVITRSRIARDSITKSMIFVKTGEVSLLGFCPCFGFCACHACSWPRLGRSTRSLRPVRKDSTRWGKADAENPSVGEPSGSKRSTSKHLGVQQLRLFKVDWSVNWDPLGLLNQRFFFLCFKTVVWFLQWCIFLSSDMLVVLKGHMWDRRKLKDCADVF